MIVFCFSLDMDPFDLEEMFQRINECLKDFNQSEAWNVRKIEAQEMVVIQKVDEVGAKGRGHQRQSEIEVDVKVKLDPMSDLKDINDEKVLATIMEGLEENHASTVFKEINPELDPDSDSNESSYHSNVLSEESLTSRCSKRKPTPRMYKAQISSKKKVKVESKQQKKTSEDKDIDEDFDFDAAVRGEKTSKNGRPAHCPWCPKIFKNLDGVKKHSRLMHADKAIFCDLCPMRFKSKKTYDCHRDRIHNDGRGEHVCHHCGMRFHFADSMKRHQQSEHSKIDN